MAYLTYCSGNFTWSQGSLSLDRTALTNIAAGEMHFDGSELSGSQSNVTNAGKLYKNDPTSTTLGLPFYNSGQFYIVNGALIVNREFDCSGDVIVSESATFVSSKPLYFLYIFFYYYFNFI